MKKTKGYTCDICKGPISRLGAKHKQCGWCGYDLRIAQKPYLSRTNKLNEQDKPQTKGCAEMNLEDLGLTKEEAREMVINKIVDELLDHDGEDEFVSSTFEDGLHKYITKIVEQGVEKCANEHLSGRADEIIKNTVFQKTNEYGQKRGDPMTFQEFLVFKAEEYMLETVDCDGKPKGKSSYFKGVQTRVSHMIDRYLYMEIQRAMELATKNANTTIANGIEKTVKMQLKQLSENMRIVAKPKG